jgi:hypothetical protein
MWYRHSKIRYYFHHQMQLILNVKSGSFYVVCLCIENISYFPERIMATRVNPHRISVINGYSLKLLKTLFPVIYQECKQVVVPRSCIMLQIVFEVMRTAFMSSPTVSGQAGWCHHWVVTYILVYLSRICIRCVKWHTNFSDTVFRLVDSWNFSYWFHFTIILATECSATYFFVSFNKWFRYKMDRFDQWNVFVLNLNTDYIPCALSVNLD